MNYIDIYKMFVKQKMSQGDEIWFNVDALKHHRYQIGHHHAALFENCTFHNNVIWVTTHCAIFINCSFKGSCRIHIDPSAVIDNPFVIFESCDFANGFENDVLVANDKTKILTADHEYGPGLISFNDKGSPALATPKQTERYFQMLLTQDVLGAAMFWKVVSDADLQIADKFHKWFHAKTGVMLGAKKARQPLDIWSVGL